MTDLDKPWAYSPQPAKERAPLSFRWFVACAACYGRGWFSRTYEEEYCDCEAGKWRRIYDGCDLDEPAPAAKERG